MMKLIILASCGIGLVLVLFLAVFDEPNAMKSPGSSIKNDKDITFIDTLYAVACNGPDNVWTCGFNGTIYHSTDSGKFWTKQETSTNKTLFDIVFFDELNGLVCGQGGTVLRTENGGKTWNSVFSKNELIKSELFKMSFAGPKIGCAVGNNGTVFFTQDGGVSWKESEITDVGEENHTGMLEEDEMDPLLGEESSGREYILYAVDLSDQHVGYAVGEFSALLKTVDGGKTWDKCSIKEAMGKSLFGVFAQTKSKVWAVGIDGLMLFSENGGQTWIQKKTPIEKHLFDIKIIGDMGYAIGKEGIYIMSSDGGNTWSQVDIGAKFYLQGIGFDEQSKEKNCGWIVGAHGWIFNTRDTGKSFNIVRRSPEGMLDPNETCTIIPPNT